MKYWKIFRFEFSYRGRRPWPWLFVLVLLVLSFLMTRDGSLSEVLYTDFFINSPFAIVKTTVFGSLLWLVMAAAIAGDATARDVATGMHPLLYTTSINKAEYLRGRFLAGIPLNALIILLLLATTLDLYRKLQAVTPDSLQYLLYELFKVNTTWELSTEGATATLTATGDWRLTLQVQARKLVFDEAGEEKKVPMDYILDIGAFAPAKVGEPQNSIYLHKHRIRTSKPTIQVKVPQKPSRAGIDPHNVLIDQKRADNIIAVKS